MSTETGKFHNSRTQTDSHNPGTWTPPSPKLPPVTLVSAEQLLEQFLALGINHTESERLLLLSCSALNAVLEALDARAFLAVSITDQVSILLPRLDIDRLASLVGISTAQAQSAAAMLTLEYVSNTHFLE